jgi:xylulokinase
MTMATGDRFIVAIDLGTTALKAVLVSSRGEIVGAETEPQSVTLLPGGGAEQDPRAWWTAIVRGTRRLLANTGVPPGQVVAFNSSVHWSGTVCIDAEGRPLRPAIIWMDSRGAAQAKRITAGPIRLQGYGVDKLFTWIRKTGGAPTHSGKDSIAHILFLKEAFPDVYRRTHRFLEPKDFLNLVLTGRAAASFDTITVHWVTDNRNVNEVRYDDRLIRMAGIDRDKLPELVRPATILGLLRPAAARDLGLTPNVQVVSGAGDILAAAIGSGAVRPFDAHLSIGTSSWLVCHVPNKKTDLFHNMASIPSAIPGRYLLTNEQESAGACLTYLRDRLLYPNDELSTGPAPDDFFARIDRVASSVPAGSEGLIFAPWLNGERSPVDDSSLRGGFFNQSLATTRAHLVRAVLEGVAYNSRWLLTYVEKFIKRRLEAVTMIGGGASSDLWCQIHADVLGRPVRQVQAPVLAGARGAALQAAMALGDVTVEEIPGLVPIARTFKPNPSYRRRYDDLFRAFVDIHRNNRRLFARLNAPPK